MQNLDSSEQIAAGAVHAHHWMRPQGQNLIVTEPGLTKLDAKSFVGRMQHLMALEKGFEMCAEDNEVARASHVLPQLVEDIGRVESSSDD